MRGRCVRAGLLQFEFISDDTIQAAGFAGELFSHSCSPRGPKHILLSPPSGQILIPLTLVLIPPGAVTFTTSATPFVTVPTCPSGQRLVSLFATSLSSAAGISWAVVSKLREP